jgi:hypothetical protein
MSTDVMGAFEEVYKNPQRCGHEAQSCLRNRDMKDGINVGVVGESPYGQVDSLLVSRLLRPRHKSA